MDPPDWVAELRAEFDAKLNRRFATYEELLAREPKLEEMFATWRQEIEADYDPPDPDDIEMVLASMKDLAVRAGSFTGAIEELRDKAAWVLGAQHELEVKIAQLQDRLDMMQRS